MRLVQTLLISVMLVSGCSRATSTTTDKAPSTPAPTPEPQPKVEGTPQPTLPKGTVVLEAPPRAPVTLRVEVATTPRQQQMGLMFRQSMPDGEGMLFVFAAEKKNSFWMHNTLIPLDMFFIDADFNVVGVVEDAEPLTDDPREVDGLSQYVLEVNAGFAEKHGFGAGTKVRFTPPEGL
jgi:hypothetical protein